MRQQNNEASQCTECGVADMILFSNRPLHKGKKETLLICLSCASESAHTVVGCCDWCGAQGLGAKTKSGRLVCASCRELCKELAEK